MKEYRTNQHHILTFPISAERMLGWVFVFVFGLFFMFGFNSYVKFFI